VRACRAQPEGTAPADLAIIRTRGFTVEQTNSMCVSCHAKGIPLTAGLPPGERFFDHFDLIALEHHDFSPDGRDLGENYTQTLWLTSPCLATGKLDCLHCHTSSGRNRYADNPDAACLPCHEERVAEVESHSRHRPGTPGGRCIDCHMPRSEFARMERHDHSMRPPTPAATLKFASPNACNLCHADKDAAWADGWVRRWRDRDYQAPVLHRAGLIDAARREDWSRLDEMLQYVADPEHDPVFAASLIRLLRSCEAPEKWPAIVGALEDPSPLVRGSAVDTLSAGAPPEALGALLAATRDDYRLVRVRAAAALAGLPGERLEPQDRAALEAATAEFVGSLNSRPDDGLSHYNLGNYRLARQEYRQAVTSYETALRLRPDLVEPLVNVAHAYSLQGDQARAESSLREALAREPGMAAAHLNLGLLLGEMGRSGEAKAEFRAALKSEPEMATAAYNLGVLLAGEGDSEGLTWLARAAELRPREPRFAYSLAFYRWQGGDADGAIAVLRDLIARVPGYPDSYHLLGGIYEETGRLDEAREVYRDAAESPALAGRDNG
jgi:tetratricopeptide (TPR) repeat protein